MYNSFEVKVIKLILYWIYCAHKKKLSKFFFFQMPFFQLLEWHYLLRSRVKLVNITKKSARSINIETRDKTLSNTFSNSSVAQLNFRITDD